MASSWDPNTRPEGLFDQEHQSRASNSREAVVAAENITDSFYYRIIMCCLVISHSLHLNSTVYFALIQLLCLFDVDCCFVCVA